MCEPCGEVYSVPISCDLIVCSKCGKRRFNRLKRKYYPIIKNFQNLKFLTVTWVKETVTRSDILYRHRLVRRLIKKFYFGGFYTFEGLAQHAHCIVVGKFVPVRLISQTWNKMTKGSKIVYIKRCNPAALNYLLKYVSKPPNFQNKNDMLDYYLFWYKHRRIATVGVFYNAGLKVKFHLLCPICRGFLRFWDINDASCESPLFDIFITNIVP